MSERMTKELVIMCLNQVNGHSGNPKGVLSHSDRGSQYSSIDYQRLLKNNSFICYMSRKGKCWIMLQWKVSRGNLNKNGLMINILKLMKKLRQQYFGILKFIIVENEHMQLMFIELRKYIKNTPQIFEVSYVHFIPL